VVFFLGLDPLAKTLLQIYGRSLSALVIGGENALEADLEDSKREGNADGITFRKKLQHSSFKFSDNLEARVVSVDC
jgi:hypothetical protein